MLFKGRLRRQRDRRDGVGDLARDLGKWLRQPRGRGRRPASNGASGASRLTPCGDPDGSGTVVLACGKNNLARKPKSLGFAVEGMPAFGKDSSGREIQVATSRVGWVGEVETTANEVAGAGAGRRTSGRRPCR